MYLLFLLKGVPPPVQSAERNQRNKRSEIYNPHDAKKHLVYESQTNIGAVNLTGRRARCDAAMSPPSVARASNYYYTDICSTLQLSILKVELV